MNVIIQLFTGAAGSVGFGLIFHINKKYLPVTAVGGAFGWLAYLLLSHHGNHIFVSMLVASFCVAIYAEILARVYGAPSTPFFVTSAIPLVNPGSTLPLLYECTGRGQYQTGGGIRKPDLPVCTGDCRGNGHRLVHLRPDQENETLGYCDKSNIKGFCKKMKKTVDKCWDG